MVYSRQIGVRLLVLALLLSPAVAAGQSGGEVRLYRLGAEELNRLALGSMWSDLDEALLVASVPPGTEGLAPGDVIARHENDMIQTASDLQEALAKMESGNGSRYWIVARDRDMEMVEGAGLTYTVASPTDSLSELFPYTDEMEAEAAIMIETSASVTDAQRGELAELREQMMQQERESAPTGEPLPPAWEQLAEMFEGFADPVSDEDTFVAGMPDDEELDDWEPDEYWLEDQAALQEVLATLESGGADARLMAVMQLPLYEEHEGAFEAMIGALEDPEIPVRQAAAVALVSTGSTEVRLAEQAVVEALATGNPTLTEFAFNTLANLGVPGGAMHRATQETLVRLLVHEDFEVRSSARWALGTE